MTGILSLISHVFAQNSPIYEISSLILTWLHFLLHWSRQDQTVPVGSNIYFTCWTKSIYYASKKLAYCTSTTVYQVVMNRIKAEIWWGSGNVNPGRLVKKTLLLGLIDGIFRPALNDSDASSITKCAWIKNEHWTLAKVTDVLLTVIFYITLDNI